MKAPLVVGMVMIAAVAGCGASGPTPPSAAASPPAAAPATPIVIDEMPSAEPSSATPTPTPVGNPVTVKGKGGKNTKKFELRGDYKVKVTYSGNSTKYGPTNFILSVEEVGEAESVDGLIANDVKSKGEINTNIYGFNGEYYLDVNAEGTWQVDFTPQAAAG